jgi:hypothetical protein
MKKLTDRDKLFAKQRKTRGWDDSDTWSLHTTLCKWLAPRLKRFREVTVSFPADLTLKKWQAILEKIQFSIDFQASDDYWDVQLPGQQKKHKEGLNLFFKYFEHLWW